MGGIKKHKSKDVISRKKIAENNRGSICPQNLTFSFKYLTTNKNYNLEYFKRDNMKNNRADTLNNLYEKLHELSDTT